jgi:hypothetical protein
MKNSSSSVSPPRGKPGSQSAAGKQGGKGVATGNDANQKGVIQYALIWLLVTLLLFMGKNFMKKRTIDALRNILNVTRPKGWTKRKVSFSWIKNLIIRNVYIPFNLSKIFDESKATGALFSMERMNKFQYCNFVYMLMAMPTPENVITGIIGAILVPNRAIRAKEIIDACAVSTFVTIPVATIVLYRGHLATFESAIDAPKKAAWKIVYNDLKALLATFQTAANNDQPNAISILESGSFRIKGISKRQRQVFGVSNGVASGTVDLIGNTVKKGRCLHDWWISHDNGVTWTRMAPTLDSKTQAIGLTVGANVGFRHQLIVAKAENNGPVETLFITVT